MADVATSGVRAVQAVGIISRPRRRDLSAVAPGLISWLEQQGVNVFCDRETAECISSACNVKAREEIPGLSDLLIVLGGDGTLLAAARLLGERQVPILPVNLGGLGFLTSVTLEDLYPVLERAIKGQARYSERVLLESRVMRKGRPFHCARALNDAVLNKAALARIIDLELRVNGEFVTNYKADGLIVATPTGSTAYSFSARGPIVSPRHRCLLLTPVSPHMLFDRSLVLDAEEELLLTVTESRAVVLTLDGQELGQLDAGDSVRCTGAPKPARVVTLEPRDFHQILKAKFQLPDR